MPAPSVDARRVDRLLADLDREQFPVREAASAELAKLGESAVPALKRVLRQTPSLEVRRRVEQLLSRLEEWSPERLRILRALEALEHGATPEARRLLEALAAGAPEARLTQEAKASLLRLAKRTAARG